MYHGEGSKVLIAKLFPHFFVGVREEEPHLAKIVPLYIVWQISLKNFSRFLARLFFDREAAVYLNYTDPVTPVGLKIKTTLCTLSKDQCLERKV